MELKDIYRQIRNELKEVEVRLADAIKDPERSVYRVGRYAIDSRGKQLRPALLLLAARASGRDLRKAIDLAAALELVHTATLIHDDIIDGAGIRRGKLSINHKFGSGKAILLGDYLFSRAFELIAAVNIPRVMRILLNVSIRICRGELRQLEKAFKPLSENEYFAVISDKTAALFAACCETGAIAAGASPAKAAALKRYGQNLGICFQIVDDCLDLAGHPKKTGKSTQLDKKGGKMTLPLIYLTNNPDRTKVEAVRYALIVAESYRKKALSALTKLKNDEIKMSLENLTEYVISQNI
jgi:octaprenyl-diphosphate synthase